MVRVMSRLLIVAFLATLSLGPDALAGRGDKSGTSAAPELLIPVGGRDIALGGSSVATTTGIEAIYWNPAGLSRSNFGAEAMFSHMNYIADIGVEYVAVGTSFEGFGSIGLSLKTLSFGEFEITTEDNTEGTGQMFSPTFVTVGLTYARSLTDRISVGLTTNLVSERIDRVSATGVAFSFGVQYAGFANTPGLNIGVAVKNIGPGMQFNGPGLLRQALASDNLRPETVYLIEAQKDELPSTIELGVSYRHNIDDENSLTTSGLFMNSNLSDDEYKLGLEYNFLNTLFVRGGYNLSQESRENSYIFGATAGAGVHYSMGGLDLTFDYAYRSVKYLEANHVFSLKFGF